MHAIIQCFVSDHCFKYESLLNRNVKGALRLGKLKQKKNLLGKKCVCFSRIKAGMRLYYVVLLFNFGSWQHIHNCSFHQTD